MGILKLFNNSQSKQWNQKMSEQVNAKTVESRRGSLSIRDELERQTRIQNPELARRLSNRRSRRNDQHNSCLESARRIKSWQDRTLLALIALLLVLFVVRTELAIAGEQEWGLQMLGESSAFTELALDTSITLDITGLFARVGRSSAGR